jgi:hypothetical protein
MTFSELVGRESAYLKYRVTVEGDYTNNLKRIPVSVLLRSINIGITVCVHSRSASEHPFVSLPQNHDRQSRWASHNCIG